MNGVRHPFQLKTTDPCSTLAWHYLRGACGTYCNGTLKVFSTRVKHHIPSIPMAKQMKALAVLLICLAWITSAFAAPMNGRQIAVHQSDGTALMLRVYGDEFFHWMETDEGYVVVRDFKTRDYFYARLSTDGSEYQSTGIPLGRELSVKQKGQLRKLEKKIRISRKSLQQKIEIGLKHLNRDKSGRIVLPAHQRPTSVKMSSLEDGTTANGGSSVSEAAATPVAGTVNALALLAYFPDYPGDVTVTTGEVDSFFNNVPYTADGNAASVRQYFRIQSHDAIDISHMVTGWFVAPNNRIYYEQIQPTLGTRFKELIIYRLEQLKAEGFDFTQLDGNGDGKVDCISLLYAGGWVVGGWASSMSWPGFADYGLSTTCPYQVSPMDDPLELAVVCHELGHAVCKFPDLYPYNDNAMTAGIFSLMSSGEWAGGGHHPSNVCAPMKLQAGWVSAVDVPYTTTTDFSRTTSFTLDVDGTSVVRHVNPENSKEYFVFEMRGKTGYEGPYGGSAANVCPSEGLVIYHVYEDGSNGSSSIFTADNPNCDYTMPPKVLVIEDNPVSLIPWYDDPTPDSQDAFDTGDEINTFTTPSLSFWSRAGRTIQSGIDVGNIAVSTSSLTFSIINRNPPLITATPRVVAVGGSSALSVDAPGMASYSWSKVSGPGNVTFSSSSAADTTATFGSGWGTYVLRVTMQGGNGNTIFSETTVQVKADLDEYLGHYRRLPVENGWHEGWIEFAGPQLQWRNVSGADWNLIATADPDTFVTDSTCPYGAGLNMAFSRQRGEVVKFKFSGEVYIRCTPFADNQSVSTNINVQIGVTLTASDAEDEPIVSYTVVSGPFHGVLSGSAPNLTYTPDTDYVGGDCITFTASDGTYMSNVATVTIKVNTMPAVDAGPDQMVYLNGSLIWQPDSLNPQSWYDASDASTITESNGSVSEWRDKSGNSRHATQIAGSNQPATGSNTMNGLNVITLNGTDQFFNVDLDYLAGTSHSAFIVTKTTRYSNIYGAATAGQGSSSLHVGFRNSTEYRMNYWGNNWQGSIDTAFNAAGGNLLNYVWQTGTSKEIFTNGISQGTSSGAGTITAMAGGGRIGAVATPNHGHYGGDIAEIIMLTDSMPTLTRLRLEGYLAQKWGLAASLPGNHPYKGAVPLASEVTVNLDAAVTDADGVTPATLWTVVSTNPAGLDATMNIADTSAIDTTATFTAEGVYTLRLTANDGYDTVYDECIITVGTGGGPIADVNLPAGISLYGYTGESPIDAQAAFQGLIDNTQLSLVRWVNPTNGQIKELYYTTFPSAGWINEIGDLTLGQGYVVKTTATATLAISGYKSTVSTNHNLPAGYSILGFNKETPVDAETAFQELITAGKLELVRWVDPANGQIKELYYTTFPSAGWVNEIGDLTEAQGYIIKLNTPHSGFALP